MALNNEIRTLINEMAEAVSELYNLQSPITNMSDAVRIMGGTVIENPDMDGFSDGKIRKTGDDSFTIEVSPYQTEERKNFTIAHELGHLFLHMGFHSNEEKWNRQGNTEYYRNGNSKTEYQANEFAAAFLMPQAEYKRVMDQHTTGNLVNTSKVASHFHVSVDAASNRGKWLGYLEW